MKRWIGRIVVLLAVLGCVGAAAAWYLKRETTQAPTFRTAAVTRGELLVTISATGTVEPEEVVDVGAQVAGQIESFGKDATGKPIDYNSLVEEGTVLAQIDKSLYKADIESAQAQLAQAQAGQARAEADLVQMKAKLEQARRDWERAQKLGPSEALAPTTYDAYEAGFEIAKANVSVNEAAVKQAVAAVAQAQASLDRVQRNLGYCTIVSPVKGVIIARRVNIGQTVVSSLNAPSLFLIAKDLTRMQVWVAINEADSGKIHTGQPVAFTVDAFPGETFRGAVDKVRMDAQMTQNVVTYTAVVTTDNSSGRLRPYLTANVRFEVARHEDVWMVPNAALRWTPATAEQVAPEFRQQAAGNGAGAPAEAPTTRRGRQSASASAPAREEAVHGLVWAVAGQHVRPIPVRIGLTDGTNTEVTGEDLSEGLELVTGMQVVSDGVQAGSKNPFLPQFPRRGGAGGGRTGAGGNGGAGQRGAGGPGGGPPPPPM